MMKRFLSVLLGVAMALFMFSGCSGEREPYVEYEAGTLIDSPQNHRAKISGVRLTAEQPSYSLDTQWLMFDLVNHRRTDFVFSYSDMRLELQTPEGWKTIVCNQEMMPSWNLAATSQEEIQISLRDWDYDFVPGHYRLVLELSDPKENERNNLWVSGEFDLTEGNQVPLPKSSAVVVRGKLMDGMLREEKISGDFHIENTRDTYGIQDDYWEFALHNDTDQEIMYGASDIFLNVMVDGQWYLVPQRMVTMMSYQVSPKSSTSISISRKYGDWYADDFKPGHYRIVFAQNGEWAEKEFDLV